MRRHKRFMVVVAIITIFCFGSFQTANAWSMSASIDLNRAIAAAGGVAALNGGAPSTLAAGITAPGWVPIILGGCVVVAAAAGLYYYLHSGSKVANPDGSISGSGAVTLVDIHPDGMPNVETATGTGTVSNADLQAAAGINGANSSKYPALHGALVTTAVLPVTTSSQPGDLVSITGGTTVKLGAMMPGYPSTGNGLDAGKVYARYNGNVLYAVGVIGSAGSAPGGDPRYALVCEWSASVAAPSLHSSSAQQFIAAATGTNGTASAPVIAGSGVENDIDQLIHDQPNIVHFDPIPPNLVPATDAAVAAASQVQSAVAAGAASATSPATTAAVNNSSQLNAAASAANAAASTANAAAANDPTNATLASQAAQASSAANAANAAAAQGAAQAAQAAASDGNGLLGSILAVLSNFFSKFSTWADSVTAYFQGVKDQRTADDAAINASPVPANPVQGNYSGGRIAPSSLPVKGDIKTAISGYISNSPLVGLAKSLQVTPASESSDVTFSFHGFTISANFNKWDSILSGVGSALLVVVHGLAVFIVFRRD